jgi:hypothetical protein
MPAVASAVWLATHHLQYSAGSVKQALCAVLVGHHVRMHLRVRMYMHGMM